MDNHVCKQTLIKLLEESNALKHGEFTLASGQKSTYYIDGKQLSLNSKVLTEVCRHMISNIYNTYPNIDAIGGPAMGAVPLVGGLLTCWNIMLNTKNDIKGFVVRKEEKGHGLGKLVEGTLNPNTVHNCVVVEDVTTTGASAMRAVKAIQDLGHKVTVVATVVDREQGAHKLFENHGIAFISLISTSDFIKPTA